MKFNLSISLLLAVLFLGCGSDDNHEVAIEYKLQGLLAQNNVTGDASNGRTIPSITDAKAQLGMKLFFTKSLGGDTDAACVTCHHPMLGGGDNLSLSIGVAAVTPDLLGEGRVHSDSAVNYDHGFAPVPRNAPSTFNTVLWDSVLFWDGRLQSLDPSAGENGDGAGIRTPDSAFGVADASAGANLVVAQARFPVTSAEEMRGFVFEAGNNNTAVRTHLETRLNTPAAIDYITNTWESEFTPVYGAGQVNFDNIVDAIGEYERSQLFVNTPWKAYVQGNVNAISTDAKRGAILFYDSYENGGMNCVACHSGDFFTDESFHVMAIPQVGHGKGDGNEDDFGRMRETSDAADKYAFRTPTLLNTEVTGPWGHDGAYTSLRAVVAHMVNPDSAVSGYDFSQLDSNVKTTHTSENMTKSLAQLNANRISGQSFHESVVVTESDIDALVAFLQALTDPCVKNRECMSAWIPDNVAGPDSLQLNAIDQNSDLL